MQPLKRSESKQSKKKKVSRTGCAKPRGSNLDGTKSMQNLEILERYNSFKIHYIE